MIDREHKLPVKRQAEVLEITAAQCSTGPGRSSERNLLLMRAIDELHLDQPFAAAGCCAICCGNRALTRAGCMSAR